MSRPFIVSEHIRAFTVEEIAQLSAPELACLQNDLAAQRHRSARSRTSSMPRLISGTALGPASAGLRVARTQAPFASWTMISR
jgi:hypothetical protein